ncbi:MAG: methyltransferase [Clostridia bacterium]|nr:methyltransferase [Clostridia bacterium]
MPTISDTILGEEIVLETAPGLFSPAHVDRGTLAMLGVAGFAPGQKVLDLGCGCGVVGVVAARKCGAGNVWLLDVDPAAVAVARRNLERNGVGEARCLVSDGLSALNETGFDLILSNPPYQSDFAVAKAFIEKGFNRLNIGGRMLMVTKRREWYKNKLAAIFGGVKIQEIDGYFVFEAQRRSAAYARKRRK